MYTYIYTCIYTYIYAYIYTYICSLTRTHVSLTCQSRWTDSPVNRDVNLFLNSVLFIAIYIAIDRWFTSSRFTGDWDMSVRIVRDKTRLTGDSVRFRHVSESPVNRVLSRSTVWIRLSHRHMSESPLNRVLSRTIHTVLPLKLKHPLSRVLRLNHPVDRMMRLSHPANRVSRLNRPVGRVWRLE